MADLAFISQGVPHVFKEKARLTRWLKTVAKHHGTSIGALTFVLMSDDALLGFNQRYLKRSYYTDVIAFDGQAGTGISGDVLISYERTKEHATSYGVSHQHELRRVMLHGLLHLLGHTDSTPKEKARMRLLEDELLRRY